MFAIQAPHRLWTRNEYYKIAAAGLFDLSERVELIAGEIITMAPQDSQNATAVRLAENALRLAFDRGYDVRSQLPLDLSLHSQPEPDIAVVAGTPRDYRDAHPTTALLVVARIIHERSWRGRQMCVRSGRTQQ
jgi:Uma2 family endonuclease